MRDVGNRILHTQGGLTFAREHYEYYTVILHVNGTVQVYKCCVCVYGIQRSIADRSHSCTRHGYINPYTCANACNNRCGICYILLNMLNGGAR